jgi:hypothetical protein
MRDEPAADARTPRDGEAREFGAFWHGPLNPFTYACLATVPHVGAKLRLYSYDPRLDVPPGVRLEDARAICPEETFVGRYRVNGRPSIAAFSDMFRYRMIRETGCCWVDADIVCLKRPTFANDDFIYCRQADAVGTSLINNAVLRLPPSHAALAELAATAERAIDADQKWGALGPFLLTPVLTKYELYDLALNSHVCYPIEPEQFWKLFLAGYQTQVAEACREASLVHLWSEAIRWSGYDVWTCPPFGSSL